MTHCKECGYKGVDPLDHLIHAHDLIIGPKEMADMMGRKRKKWTRVEAIAYLAGMHDGCLVGSFTQYIDAHGDIIFENMKKASEAFNSE